MFGCVPAWRLRERECCTCMSAYAPIHAVVHRVMVSRQRSSTVQEEGLKQTHHLLLLHNQAHDHEMRESPQPYI